MVLRHFIATVLIMISIISCVSTNKSDTATDKLQLPLKEIGVANCTVDSSLYSAPYLMHSGKFAPVPMRDGFSVSIDATKHPEMRVLIEGKNVFQRCRKQTAVIETIDQAKLLLKLTKIDDFQRFVGSEFTSCLTVDEEWFFLYKKPIGYIGYTGPAELPLSFIGMQCN